MKNSKTGSLLAAASILAMGAGISPVALQADAAVQAAHAAQQSKTSPVNGLSFNNAMAAIFGSQGVSRTNRRNPGPGWSNRHVKRMALKRRNVIRNRKNHR